LRVIPRDALVDARSCSGRPHPPSGPGHGTNRKQDRPMIG
jgi:hypothetical protein